MCFRFIHFRHTKSSDVPTLISCVTQLVLRDLCAGVDEDAPCYSVLLSVHERGERANAPATPLGPDGVVTPAKAKHSNRCGLRPAACILRARLRTTRPTAWSECEAAAQACL